MGVSVCILTAYLETVLNFTNYIFYFYLLCCFLPFSASLHFHFFQIARYSM